MLNSHGEVILGVNDDIRPYEQPSDSGTGRIAMLTVRIVNLLHSAGIKLNIRLRTGVLEMMAPYHIEKANH
jgi:hypothetical protein